MKKLYFALSVKWQNDVTAGATEIPAVSPTRHEGAPRNSQQSPLTRVSGIGMKGEKRRLGIVRVCAQQLNELNLELVEHKEQFQEVKNLSLL